MVLNDTGGGAARENDSVLPVNLCRRRLLVAAAGGAIGGGLAGCSEVTQQEFAATPVRLPAPAGEELGLAETFTDSQTTTRGVSAGGQDIEVTITSHYAGYQRSYDTGGSVWASPRPTLVERFAGFAPGATPGSGAAINAVATELELGQSNPSYVEGDTPVPGDRITVVIPERARHDGELHHGKLMALHHAEALGVDELTSRGENNYLVEGRQILPDREMAPSDKPDWRPDERWIPGQEPLWLPDDLSSLRCIVCLGERSPDSLFGIDEMPGRRLDDGETIATENTLVFVPAPKEYPGLDDWSGTPEDVFDAGYPTPMGGPTYALGVIATPNAEVGGESINPVARMGMEELLVSDLAYEVLPQAGLTDAEEVEWIRGPEEAQDIVNWLPFDTVSVLESDVPLECYTGVVSGIHGPWAVAIHMGKVTDEDVVIPAAIHRRPVGTPDNRELIGGGSGFIDRQWTTRALELTAEAFPSLEPGISA